MEQKQSRLQQPQACRTEPAWEDTDFDLGTTKTSKACEAKISSPSEDTPKAVRTSREGKTRKRPTLTKPETLLNSTSDLHIFCQKKIKSSLKLNNIIPGLPNVSNSMLGKQPKLPQVHLEDGTKWRPLTPLKERLLYGPKDYPDIAVSKQGH